MPTESIQLNAFQERLLSVPEEFDMFLGGGRGGGKSYGIAYLILRHAEQYGVKARILYLRKSYKGLADFELTCREVFGAVYGTAARYNAQEHVWSFPNGSYLELGQLESHADYAKYQGRSFTLLVVDEAGQYATPDLLDMMRSNMRGAKDVPVRMVIAANPGGSGHHWLAKRYVFAGAAPWEVFHEARSKRRWVYAPSTFAGNTLIDREQYREQLESSCPDDPELLRAWLDGDWAISRGAYFASCLEESRNAVDPWEELSNEPGWEHYLAHDFGSSAPSVTYLIARSPGASHEGRSYPNGSLILVDELAAVSRSNLNLGLGWTAAITGEAIRRDLCAPWNASPYGVADDACFARTGSSNGSIADEFATAGVWFQPARKADRVSGWQLMKRLLADAGKPDKPGLYVSRDCDYWWSTVPYLSHDVKRREDLDTHGPDHAADSCRYGLLAEGIARGIEMSWPL
jgi:hypothetical protein